MKYYILLVLCTFWSGNFIFGRLISNDISPIELSFYRWFLYFLILLPFILVHYKNLLIILKKKYLILFCFRWIRIAGFNTFFILWFTNNYCNKRFVDKFNYPIFIIIFQIILKFLLVKYNFLEYFFQQSGFLFDFKRWNRAYLWITFYDWDLWIIAACIDWALYSVLLKYKTKRIKHLEFFL